MTNKEKIIKIMQQASQKFNEKFDENFQLRMKERFRYGATRRIYGSVTYDEYIADALIAAGVGDTVELKQELKAQEGAANAYRICFEEQKYWREVAEHRAAVAERALLNACRELSDDIEKLQRCLYKAYVAEASQQLAEQKTESKDVSR